MSKKFKMTPTLEQFKAGIKKCADNLRKHGLLDPSVMNKSTYSPSKAKKKIVDEDDILPPVVIQEAEAD